MLTTYQLKNGVKIATYNLPIRSVFVGLAVKAGSIFDTPQKCGVAHLMEHMLMQGTESWPDAESLANFVETFAGSFNASTGFETIRFTAHGPASFTDSLLKLASEVFTKPTFPPPAFQREKMAILEEIRSIQDSHWYRNYKFVSSIRFQEGHPLLLDQGGSLDSLPNLQLIDLVNFWQKFFNPGNFYLVVIGGFNQKTITAHFEKYFSKGKSTGKLISYPKLTNQDLSTKQVAIRFDKNLGACYLSLSFPTCADTAPLIDRVTHVVIRYILGGLRSSRLFKRLRQQTGLVYEVNYQVASFHGFGFVDITSQTSETNLEKVITIIVDELKDLKNHGPLQDEVTFAKNYYINSILLDWDHPGQIASWIGHDLLWEDQIYTSEEFVKIIEKVDLTMIKQFINKYWDFGKINLVVQGPTSDTKPNIDMLNNFIKEL